MTRRPARFDPDEQRVTILGRGGPADRRSLELHTRAGNRIANERTPPRPPEAMRAAMEMMRKAHPTLVPRSLDATYNCVGMVFANRRTWIEPDQVQLVFDDDGYRKLDRMNDAMPGDVAVYRDASNDIVHVGLIVDVP